MIGNCQDTCKREERRVEWVVGYIYTDVGPSERFVCVFPVGTARSTPKPNLPLVDYDRGAR